MEEAYNPELLYGTTEPAIPARIVIGVTGHREIENPVTLGAAIQAVLKKIRQMAPATKSTPSLLSVLSPLAEGADRLIAREILKIPGSLLEVVLPLEKAVYLEDFATDASKTEFEELLNLAKNVRVLPAKDSREEAYEQVGRYIVAQCDILIAVWDGKTAAGKGGTQEIIQYARDNHCPLVWINAENYSQINFETGKGFDPRPFHDLDDYNQKRINHRGYDEQLHRDIGYFSGHAGRAGLALDGVKPVIKYVLNHYVRADRLALYYQHLYYRSETLVYSLALAAVIVASFQSLFLPDIPLILVSEIVLMLAVLGTVWLGRRRRWHERWIDYRFIAERFRSALFMAIAGVDAAVLRPPRHLSLAYSPKDWMVAAFSAIWRLKPGLPPSEPASFENVKQFLAEAWLEDQIRYHEATRERHLARNRRLTVISYLLFGLTVITVLLHIVGVGPNNHNADTVLKFLTVVFPAVASSLGAIRTHRDYLRNSMRSGEMVGHLKELKERMSRTHNRGEFLELVKETEETMLHENEDWRVVVRFHRTEVRF
jgi:uncharacterized protein (TIGR03382 family)